MPLQIDLASRNSLQKSYLDSNKYTFVKCVFFEYINQQPEGLLIRNNLNQSKHKKSHS